MANETKNKCVSGVRIFEENAETRRRKAENIREVRERALEQGKEIYFKKGDPRTIENASKGGIAKAKKMKQRKAMREVLGEILDLQMNAGRCTNMEEIQSFASMKGLNLDVKTALLMEQVKIAMEGGSDAVKAFKVLADLMGEFSTKVEFDYKADNKNKLDSIVSQTTQHQTYDEEDLKAMEECEDVEVKQVVDVDWSFLKEGLPEEESEKEDEDYNE